MKILIATDAWAPQVNGVVRTYQNLATELVRLGVDPILVTPGEFRTVPCPTYPEIRLALPGYQRVAERFRVARPDAVHIATEGPIGLMSRIYCCRHGIPFTTSFHTRFPEYLGSRFGIPSAWTYRVQRWFHQAGEAMMVSTPTLARELEAKGFEHVVAWTRGVDTALFQPRNERLFGARKPVLLYVGRIAVEKNIEAFLKLNVPGTKVVVGTGPLLEACRNRYRDVIFAGLKTGEALARCYASADVFVFPSRTDTFGNVLLEAMASGIPIAAYPVTGPIDIVRPGETGVLDENLAAAVAGALKLDRATIRAHALSYSWEKAARLFLSNIQTALFARSGLEMPTRSASICTRSLAP